MNEPPSENTDRSPRRGDRDVPRRGDRVPQERRRDNSSYGERRGKRYDGSETGRSDGSKQADRQDARPRSAGDDTARRGAASDGGSGPRRAPVGGRGGGNRRDGGDRRGAGAPGGARRGGRTGDDRRSEGRPGQEARQAARADEPQLPDDIEAADLDLEIRRDLRSLDKSNAESVAKHMVAAMYLVDEDPQLALAHGRAAKNRAGRIGVVRETLGVLAYRAGEWSEALSELRAARRISGGPGLLAMMADCERGLERPQRAIELARGDESRLLEGDELIELRIVEAGARVDMGQLDAALVTLQDAGLDKDARGESAARLDYAYAEVLLVADRKREAADWFSHAVTADPEQTTDAEARLAELEA
ncbi:tetratricopeptide repeat protein [Dietzia maris]|uniref:hypothetical protein n=1 Tax=Dietzia maris TaxID=37915 RepID=UPI001D047A5C